MIQVDPQHREVTTIEHVCWPNLQKSPKKAMATLSLNKVTVDHFTSIHIFETTTKYCIFRPRVDLISSNLIKYWLVVYLPL